MRDLRAVGLPVLTPKVDIANVRVEFESGCVANFTASRVSTERVRKLRFFQPQQYISLDYSRRDVFMLTVKPAGRRRFLPEIVASKPEVVSEEPLRAELRSFLEAVASRTRPVVSLEDGRRALALALQVRSRMEEHSRRVGLRGLNELAIAPYHKQAANDSSPTTMTPHKPDPGRAIRLIEDILDPRYCKKCKDDALVDS